MNKADWNKILEQLKSRFKERVKEPKLEEIKLFCANPSLVNYVCMWNRPGFRAWAVELEYTKFKPDTDANLGFHLFFIRWPKDNPLPPEMAFAVVSIDRSGQSFAEQTLWKHGLKRCKPGFVQMILDSKGRHEFPIQGPNTFSLESTSGNVAYTNDPVKMKAAIEHEDRQIDKFLDEHKRWLETPEGKATADAFWAKHPRGSVG